jgi:formamidopyrimidine-DNA glycosylase
MPELPEVETYARYFARHALRQRIARVEVRDERILGEIRRDVFARRLKGREFTSVRRHGKHLFAGTGGAAAASAADESNGGPWLHLHFGMTGDLTYGAEIPRFARIVFTFDGGGKLSFEDMRLFGLADLVSDPDVFVRERNLGPDPLQITAAQFASLLEKRRGAVKSLLMTQEVIAGLGNLYVDETLYQTSIHPRRPADRIRPAEVRAVYTTMRRILRETITRHARESELPRNYLIHHREEGERCPRCGGTIRRTVVFGRTTYFCGKHQR